MIYLLALSILINVALIYLGLRYVQSRDEREQKERTQLIQRIQAPEVAVAQAVEIPEQPLKQHAMEDEDVERYIEELTSG